MPHTSSTLIASHNDRLCFIVYAHWIIDSTFQIAMDKCRPSKYKMSTWAMRVCNCLLFIVAMFIYCSTIKLCVYRNWSFGFHLKTWHMEYFNIPFNSVDNYNAEISHIVSLNVWSEVMCVSIPHMYVSKLNHWVTFASNHY